MMTNLDGDQDSWEAITVVNMAIGPFRIDRETGRESAGGEDDGHAFAVEAPVIASDDLVEIASLLVVAHYPQAHRAGRGPARSDLGGPRSVS